MRVREFQAQLNNSREWHPVMAIEEQKPEEVFRQVSRSLGLTRGRVTEVKRNTVSGFADNGEHVFPLRIKL